MTNNIPIFLSSDNNYAPFVATTIASICDNTKSFCNFYILDGGITDENKERICELKKQFNNFSIEFIKIEVNKIFKNVINKSNYISIATYSRFLIPQLKPNIGKCLYLDIDIIVLADIKNLFEEALGDKTIAAVKDYDSELRNRKLLCKKHKYFNAGIMLIDCDKWRKNNVTKKLFEIEKRYRNQLDFADQDLLNKYFECNYKQLDLKYNVIGKNKNIIIRHFAGILKPWELEENIKTDLLEDSYLFWKYAKITPFYSKLKNSCKYKKLNDLRLIRVKYATCKAKEMVKVNLTAKIPKIIFYSWGIGEKKPEKVVKCINTWHNIMPDYEIIEINEDSKNYFDFQKELKDNKWFKAVYERKMYAYVSDYVRIKTLYNNGGIYLDTDVSVLKPFDKFLSEPAFVGLQSNMLTEPAILGAKKNNKILAKILKFYDGGIWKEPIYNMPQIFDHFLSIERNGETSYSNRSKQKIIRLENITIYPECYFVPYRYNEEFSPSCIKKNTYSIHWFNGSWLSPKTLFFLKNKHLIPLEKLDEEYQAKKVDLERLFRVMKNLHKIKKFKAKF